MTSAFAPVGIGGGGAMFAPAISPHDPRLVFVATDMGAIYRSVDGGETWTMIDKRQLREGAWCPVVFHPRDPHVVYAAVKGSLATSTDRGATWRAVCETPPWGEAPCTALEVDEQDADLMLAGSRDGAHRSVDGGRTWVPCDGVSGMVTGIVLLPAGSPDGPTCVVGASTGIFRSDDGGRAWKRSDGVPLGDVRGLAAGAAARSPGFIVYAAVSNGSADGAWTGGLWRSTDEGRTWERVAGDAHGERPQTRVADRAAYGPPYERVQTTRRSAEIVYATVRCGSHVAIHRSDDAGATWRPIMDGADGSEIPPNVAAGWVVADHVWQRWAGASRGLAVSRRDANHAIFTSEGEIYRTTDGGATWVPIYSRLEGDDVQTAPARRSRSIGLEVTTVWDVVFDPHDPARAYICYTDIGFARSLDRGVTWSHAARGIPWSNTVYQVAFDPDVPGLLYAACSTQHDIPHWLNIEGPRGEGGVCVSRDWGATWAPIGKRLPHAPATSIVLDPRSAPSARTLYVTQHGAGVYTSTDGGATWRRTTTTPGCPDNRHVYRLKLCADGTLYCTITGRREGYAFPSPGGLYRSRDGGETWTCLTNALALRWPGDVDTPPDDSTTIYLGVASAPGFSQGGVYKSLDDGKTWHCLLSEPEFPQEVCTYAHALFVTVDPAHPATIYVGATTHGLFVSHDAGTSWREVPGIPFTGCQRVAFDRGDPATIWVTTFGGGVWKGAVPR